MLILPIKKKWFDMIASGEKKEEYREIKPYWDSRFQKVFYNNRIRISRNLVDKEIIFKNGYRKDSPKMICKCRLKIGQGKPEWGAEEGKEYYVLEILEILEG